MRVDMLKYHEKWLDRVNLSIVGASRPDLQDPTECRPVYPPIIFTAKVR